MHASNAMTNWASFPSELLKLIVDILASDNDRNTLTQFQLVCKHWNKSAACINFTNVKITRLENFSALVEMILVNPVIGTAIRNINIDVRYTEECAMNGYHKRCGKKVEDAQAKEPITDFEHDRLKTLRDLFSTILRFIPNTKSLLFDSKDNLVWYEILQKRVECQPLRNLEVIAPPTNLGDVKTYTPLAWKLRQQLKKVVFFNRETSNESYSSDSNSLYDIKMMRNANKFTNLTEIRIELCDIRCSLPELETVVDNAPASVECVAFATSFSPLRAGDPASPVSSLWIKCAKVRFPNVDTSTTKQLSHVRRLHTLDSYFCDDNAVKYIIHKFPNVQELWYDIQSDPWDFYEVYGLVDTPDRLSPSVQTMYFEYFMKMKTFVVFGIYEIDEYGSLIRRWMEVADTIEDKLIALTINQFSRVQDQCYYIFWRKSDFNNVYDISINFSPDSIWSCSLCVMGLGRCLECLTLQYVEIDGETLEYIFQDCPVLSRLEFSKVQIIEEINTYGVISNLSSMTFSEIEDDSIKYIPSVTKWLPSLTSLQILETDMTVPTSEDEQKLYKDVEFYASPANLELLRYRPETELHSTREFVPPWCIIINDDKLYINPEAFSEGPYHHIIIVEEVPLSEFEHYKRQIVPSKKDHSYCARVKCKGLEFFQLAELSRIPCDLFQDFPDNCITLCIKE